MDERQDKLPLLFAEYALDPSIVLHWVKTRQDAYFKDQFGTNVGRLVAKYPKRWAKSVWDLYEKETPQGGRSDSEKKKLELLVEQISKTKMVRRPGTVSGDWLAHAEKEHERARFHAVITRENPRNRDFVLPETDLHHENTNSPLWTNFTPTVRVPRTATDYGDALGPLLRVSQKIVFVDRHLTLDRERYKAPLKKLLSIFWHEANYNVSGPDQKRTATIIVGDRDEEITKTQAEHIRDQYEKFLKIDRENPLIPENGKVVVRYVHPRKDGEERFHNRYILTDIAGVTSSGGLDQQEPGETIQLEDFARCSHDQYLDLWVRYEKDRDLYFDELKTFCFTG